jgi:hypothetical protein
MALPPPPSSRPGPPAGRDPPGAPAIAPGALIDGKYRVERVLGMGGMGLVVAAVHVALDRRVALKFLRASAGDTGDVASIERMLREARAVARLRSEHVARVIDVVSRPPGDATTPPYIVMEYLQGEDLAARLRASGRLSVGDASAFVLQACEAIAEAHAGGIVHRDLKPANLFLTTRVDGQPLVKVLDFGISKLTGPASPAALSLTRTADLIGTPLYMAPEQLRHARSVDPRTDQWSLGVILFELLTGALPFPATSLMDLCARVLESDPPLVQSVRADVPAPLAEAVARCLRRDPAARFASVADLAAALEPFAVGAECGAAARIRAIAHGRAATLVDPAAAHVSVPGVPAPGAPAAVLAAMGTERTDAAWGQTAGPAVTRRLKRTTRFALQAGVALALLAAAALILLARLRAADPSRTSPVVMVMSAPRVRDGAALPAEGAAIPPASPVTTPPRTASTHGAPASPPRAPVPLAPPRRPSSPRALPGVPDASVEDDFPTRN